MATSEVVLTRAVWSSRQRLILAAGWVVGAVAVTAAWWGVSGEAVFDEQFRWVAVGDPGAGGTRRRHGRSTVLGRRP
jgi:hypothetical protein